MKLSKSEIFFNVAAVVALIASIASWCLGYHLSAIFIGIWVPTIIGWMNFFTNKEARHESGGKR